MRDCFNRSKKQVNFFVMVIVGNADPDLNLWVSIHNNDGYSQLFQTTAEMCHIT